MSPWSYQMGHNGPSNFVISPFKMENINLELVLSFIILFSLNWNQENHKTKRDLFTWRCNDYDTTRVSVRTAFPATEFLDLEDEDDDDAFLHLLAFFSSDSICSCLHSWLQNAMSPLKKNKPENQYQKKIISKNQNIDSNELTVYYLFSFGSK